MCRRKFAHNQLSQELEPIGLPDLLGKLGEEYVERSARRWLTELVTEGFVQKFGQKRGTKYQVKQHATCENGKVSNCFAGSDKSLCTFSDPTFSFAAERNFM